MGAAGVLLVLGLGLGLMEGLQGGVALVTGDPPLTVERSGHSTSPVHVRDLGLVVPLMLLASAWLRRRRPWGVVAAVVLLVKGVAVGLGLLAANALAVETGTTTDGLPNVGWAVVVLASARGLGVVLRQVGAAPRATSAPGPAEDAT